MRKIAFLLLIPVVGFSQAKKGRLIWEENFNGKSLDEKVWNFELGDHGWGNHERQMYTANNHVVKDGMLIITAKKEGDKYTSTRITTAGKKEFKYGYMEARAKLPVGKGIWPAFWMLGSNIGKVGWPMAGEIDILEYVGREPHMVFTSLHTKDSHGNTVNTKKTNFENIEEGFHLYAVNWTADKIEFFVDDKPVYTFVPRDKSEEVWPFDQPFYFLLNVAVGGDFGGPEVDDSIFPQQFIIDYIKVYQK